MGKYGHYSEEARHRSRQRKAQMLMDEEYLPTSALDRPMKLLPHFCKKGLMHTCRACEDSDRQKNCHFFMPATGFSRCMELRFDEYCGNQILHKYLDNGMNDARAMTLVKREKARLAKINNRAEGYTIDFPLEGEETIEDVQYVFEQLVDLGMTEPGFWMDRTGKGADEIGDFHITMEDVEDGKWCPKRKELKKDILRYFKMRRKLGV